MIATVQMIATVAKSFSGEGLKPLVFHAPLTVGSGLQAI
jgi:hypothetical protein